MSTWPTVSGTGHRPQHLPPGVRRWIQPELYRIACKLRDEHGTRVGCSGMALGFDLWWADAIVRAGLALSAHIPFPQQPDLWHPEDQAEYRRLLALADEVIVYGDEYSVGLLHARNDGMLSAGDVLVACHRLAKKSGGTWSVVVKAKRQQMPCIHLDPDHGTVRLVDYPVIGAGHGRGR